MQTSGHILFVGTSPPTPGPGALSSSLLHRQMYLLYQTVLLFFSVATHSRLQPYTGVTGSTVAHGGGAGGSSRCICKGSLVRRTGNVAALCVE